MMNECVLLPSCVIKNGVVNNTTAKKPQREGVDNYVITYYLLNNLINNNTTHNTVHTTLLSEYSQGVVV